MKTIKTSLTHRRGQKVQFSIDDKPLVVEFDNLCKAQVEVSVADKLISQYEDIVDADQVVVVDGEVQAATDVILESLLSMKLDELRAIAREKGIPNEQWIKLSKKDLATFLRENGGFE